MINEAGAEQKRDVLEFVEEKFERRLSGEIGGLEMRLSQKIDAGDKALSEKIDAGDKALSEKISNVDNRVAKLEGSLDAKINGVKADLIKWMFIFWVGQVGMILGILFAFFKRQDAALQERRCRNSIKVWRNEKIRKKGARKRETGCRRCGRCSFIGRRISDSGVALSTLSFK